MRFVFELLAALASALGFEQAQAENYSVGGTSPGTFQLNDTTWRFAPGSFIVDNTNNRVTFCRLDLHSETVLCTPWAALPK